MRTRHLTLVLIVLSLAVCGCGSVASAPSAPPPPKVTVQHPEERELVDSDEYNGWLQAFETVEVRARVRGHIEKVHFTDGQMVKKGDLLFELDPKPFQSEIDRAREQANISLAQHDLAIKEEARYQELFKKGAASKSQLDETIASTKTFAAQHQSALAEVKRRELDLEYSKITAPIDGKISRAYMTAGNLVNAGGSDPLLTTIVTTNPIQIYIYVDERSLQQYQKRRKKSDTEGLHLKPLKEAKIPVEFGRETDVGFPHRGVLDFAENRVDSATGTIQVRAEASNDKGIFVPGERVRVRVPISDTYRALLVPETAILTDQDKKYVLSLNEKKVVVRRNIVPGRLLDDGMRVVLSTEKDAATPLGPKDWIIVLGLQRARINYPVDPVDASGKAIETGGN